MNKNMDGSTARNYRLPGLARPAQVNPGGKNGVVDRLP